MNLAAGLLMLGMAIEVVGILQAMVWIAFLCLSENLFDRFLQLFPIIFVFVGSAVIYFNLPNFSRI